jgi:hypothetical protein
VSRDDSVSVATWLLAGRPRNRGSVPGWQRDFLFSITSRPALWSAQPPIRWVPRVVCPGVKRQGRETDHSSQRSAEVKNGGVVLPLPVHFHGVVLN